MAACLWCTPWRRPGSFTHWKSDGDVSFSASDSSYHICWAHFSYANVCLSTPLQHAQSYLDQAWHNCSQSQPPSPSYLTMILLHLVLGLNRLLFFALLTPTIACTCCLAWSSALAVWLESWVNLCALNGVGEADFALFYEFLSHCPYAPVPFTLSIGQWWKSDDTPIKKFCWTICPSKSFVGQFVGTANN